MVNNYDWFGSVRYIEFLRDIGKLLTVNYMTAKESVRARLEDGLLKIEAREVRTFRELVKLLSELVESETTRPYWAQQLVSETAEVYRAEFLAASIVFDAEQGEGGLSDGAPRASPRFN